MTIGDVVWVEFPSGAGRAQAGRRPGIVLQTDALPGARIPTVLIVPLTTQRAALRFPGTVLVEPNVANSLRSVSVALVFQLTAVDGGFVAPPQGAVTETIIANLLQALDELTGRATSAHGKPF